MYAKNIKPIAKREIQTERSAMIEHSCFMRIFFLI